MGRIEKTLEMRGMKREAIVDYFTDLGGQPLGDGRYSGPDWEVYIGPQESCSLGRIVIPSITVTFFVEESIYDNMLSGFRLKFLCAGG